MKYSWETYQLYMMGLSLVLIGALVGLEFFLRNFDLLHVVYNQMLRLKERKLICFNQFEVTGNHPVRSSTFMMTRLTLILALCYVWQFCVIESYTWNDSTFPEDRCFEGSGFHCFQTRASWEGFVRTDQMVPIDCTSGAEGFVPISQKFGVSCYKLIDQNAAVWLQSLAVANALGLLLTRVYEVSVWVSVQSLTGLFAVTLIGLGLAAAVIITMISGIFSSLVNSWLGLMSLGICPLIAFVIRNASIEIRRIEKNELQKIFERTTAEFSAIARDFSSVSNMRSPSPFTSKGSPQLQPTF